MNTIDTDDIWWTELIIEKIHNRKSKRFDIAKTLGLMELMGILNNKSILFSIQFEILKRWSCSSCEWIYRESKKFVKEWENKYV